MIVLEGNHLKKYFESGDKIVKAVDDISLSVSKGEFISIIGSSGSGKTTLLNILGGMDTPTGGQVFLHGKNLSDMDDEARTIFRRRNIGFVFQDYNLIPIMNVKENIVLPVEMDGQFVDHEYFLEIIDIIGIKRILHAMPNTLSGGEKQRVAIARALIGKPAIILADEPTGNLDTRSSDDVMSLLAISNKDLHQSIIMITHNPTLSQMADRIIRIEDGKIKKNNYV